jgi:hypothetical protein
MAQTGFTPIQLYSSSTATNVPLAANLATGELAINITDGKLFYKDNANAVQVIGWKTVPATAGGTGQTSYAVGDLLYADTTTTLAKLPDVATGNALISGGVGVAPSWGKIGLTTHVSGTLGVTNGGTGTSTAFTAGSVVFAGASGVYSQDNTNLFWDDTNNRLGLGINSPSYIFQAYETAPAIASGGTTYLGSSATIGASFVLRSENTASWTGTRELISFDSVGNGADHRTGTLSVKLKAASGDSTLTEYLQLNPTFGYSNFPSGDLKIGTGNLVVSTSGKGIDFSATPGTGTSELLADYEEGDWTPVLQSWTIVGTSPAVTGRYTKIGRQVYLYGQIAPVGGTVSYAATAGTSYVNGLPFAVGFNSCGSWSDASNAANVLATNLVNTGNNIYAPTIAATADVIIFACNYTV